MLPASHPQPQDLCCRRLRTACQSPEPKPQAKALMLQALCLSLEVPSALPTAVAGGRAVKLCIGPRRPAVDAPECHTCPPLAQVQQRVRLCISRDLSEHDIVQRIMRKENYLIGAPATRQRG